MTPYQKLRRRFTLCGNGRWLPSGESWNIPNHVTDPQRLSQEVDISNALSHGKVKSFRRLLAAYPGTLSVETARLCCYLALSHKSYVLAMVLHRCPPAQRLFYANVGADLVYLAAVRGKHKHLKLLLDYGADLGRHQAGFPPLAAAALCGRDHCLPLLLDALEPEQLLTPELLEVWALMGTGAHRLDHSIRLIAARLPEVRWEGRFPIPPGLTPLHAMRNDNLRLLAAICRRTPLTHEEALSCAKSLICHSRVLPQLLNIILTAAPELLRRPQIRGLLVYAALHPDSGLPDELHPWVSQLKGPHRLCGGSTPNLFFPFSPREERFTWAKLLHRWEQRLPAALHPALDHRYGLTACPFPSEAEFELLLSRCRLLGSPPRQEVGPLAMAVLALASPERVAMEIKPGGLLDCEPLALQQLCRDWLTSGEDLEEEHFFHLCLTPLPIRSCRVKLPLLCAANQLPIPEYEL